MKQINKSNKLDNVCYDIRGPVLDEAYAMTSQGIDILKLNIGNPGQFGFNAPDEIIEEITCNLRNAQGYCESKGILSARQAVLKYCQAKKFPNVTVEDIYIGNGVSELIVMCMQGLLNDGDEMLIPAPDYPLWTAAVNLAGGKAVHYLCDEQSEWYPDINDIRKKVTKKTKGIVIINPNNPTGALYPKEILEQIIQIACENNLIIFSDEIYDRLVMDGLQHISIASLAPDLFVVTLNGLSKSHLIAGFRTGWMALSGDKSNVKGYIEGLNMLSSMRLCANVPAQYAIGPALREEQKVDKMLLPGGRIYKQREFITEAINRIPGLSCVKPKAAFYLFPRIDIKKFNIVDDQRFILDFLRGEKVLLVQGTGFNWPWQDHFRIVYLPEISQLKIAMERLEHFLTGYRQEQVLTQ
jgi:alanine-synthesizing transaminase